IAAAALALSAPDPPRGASEETIVSAEAPPVGSALAGLGSNFRYVGTVLGYVPYTFALAGMQLWIPKVLSEVRGLDLARADYMVGVLTFVAGLGGTFAGGYLGDVLSGRMKYGQLWLCGASSLAGIVPMWLALTIASPSSYWIWLFTAEFLLFL